MAVTREGVRGLSTRHVRWDRTGADEHASSYEEARAALLLGQMVHDRRTELGMTQAEFAAGGYDKAPAVAAGVRRRHTKCAVARAACGGAQRGPGYLLPAPRRPRRLNPCWTPLWAATRCGRG